MEKIASVDCTVKVPDEVLAQAAAATADWHCDTSGSIFDQSGVYVAASLTEVALAMRALGWFPPTELRVTGVLWRNISASVAEQYDVAPEDSHKTYWADLVREEVYRLRAG